MKKQTKIVSLILALIITACALLGCSRPATEGPRDNATEGIWDNATYTEDAVIGEGAITVRVSVTAEDKTVLLTVKTDKTVLGDALMEYGLIAGEEGAYGLYVKTVNGILADYDTDRYYWGFYQNGEYMLTGVDTTPIADGEAYELVRTK